MKNETNNRIGWNDKYKTKLAIYDHLTECTRKYEKYKDVGSLDNQYLMKKIIETLDLQLIKEYTEQELYKELVDLFLLIESIISQGNMDDLVQARIKRFKEKSKEQK